MRAAIAPILLGLGLAQVTSAIAAEPTPAQTEGPYYPLRKPTDSDADLTRIGTGAAAQGEPLVLVGVVAGTDGKPIPGARVEIWQTDHQGVYAHPRDPGHTRHDSAFQSYGADTTGETGSFAFRTIMPGRYGGRPRHIHVKVTPPGGKTLTTQLYFRDDTDLKVDEIVGALGKSLERVMLSPKRSGDGKGPLAATITLVVQRRA